MKLKEGIAVLVIAIASICLYASCGTAHLAPTSGRTTDNTGASMDTYKRGEYVDKAGKKWDVISIEVPINLGLTQTIYILDGNGVISGATYETGGKGSQTVSTIIIDGKTTSYDGAMAALQQELANKDNQIKQLTETLEAIKATLK